MREGTDKYDDKSTGGYSYAEKLKMVAGQLMAPEEIGLKSADDAIFEITGKEPTKPFLSDWLTFEVSEVPISLVAHVAMQDLKVRPGNPKDWEADFCEKHAAEHTLQAIMKSGSCSAVIGQTVTEVIPGFAHMLRQVADLLEKKWVEVQKDNPQPYKTRDDIRTAEELQRNQLVKEALPPEAIKKLEDQ